MFEQDCCVTNTKEIFYFKNIINLLMGVRCSGVFLLNSVRSNRINGEIYM